MLRYEVPHTTGTIVFAIYRLIAVLLRMKVGFDKGAKAYNTVEVKHRESQIYYIDRYDEFLETPGLYEAAAERYGGMVVGAPATIGASGTVSPCDSE